MLVALGALVLLISLFLDWYQPTVTAWEAFEVLDLLLAALGVAALVARRRRDPTRGHGHRAPLAAARSSRRSRSSSWRRSSTRRRCVDGDPDTGAWLALGAAVVMCIGTLLTLGRVSFALTVEGRDTRRRVSAVDARTDPTTTEGPAVTAARET